MNLSPRQLGLRLLLWSVLLAWAVWKMRGGVGETALAPSVRTLDAPVRALPAPSAPAGGGEAAPPTVDPLRLLDTLAEARTAADTCGVRGAILSVRVGAAGLEAADLEGQVTDAAARCFTERVWALSWPRGQEPTTTSMEVPAG